MVVWTKEEGNNLQIVENGVWRQILGAPKMYRLGGDLNSVVCSIARDVNQRNSALTNSCSLIYILHFVLAVTP